MKNAFSAAPAVALSLIGVAAAAPAWAGAGSSDWTGFYLGLNAGEVSNRSDAATTTVYSPTGYFAASSVPAVNATGDQKVHKTGFTGGLTAGYNWQVNHLVLGVETDFNAVGANGSQSGTTVYPCCSPTTFTVRSSVSSDWQYTLRARAGVAAAPGLLVYGTAGLAVADVNGDFRFTDTFASAHESASISKTKTGWTAGLGGEYALKDGWSVKAEYLYADYGKVSTHSTNLTAFSGPIAFPTNVFTHSVELRASSFRVGLNRRF